MRRSTKSICFPALLALAAAVNAQGITSSVPAVVGFVDLSTNGGTPVTPPPTDDSEHNIVTTIGNPLFPAGNVRIGNNGVAIAGITTGEIDFVNNPILPTGVPAGLPTGNGIICAFWDDLFALPPAPPPASPATSIWWKEGSGVLSIMWKNEYHIDFQAFGQTITFEIQVFSAPTSGAPSIQILYPDTTFGGSTITNGSSATVGYFNGTNPFGINLPWSFNAASVPDGTVLSIFPPDLGLSLTSPAGPGSIRLDIAFGPADGTYFLAATTAGGAYPNGWFFGLDISYAELASELAFGFPFTGPLDSSGMSTLGPFSGLPSGLTVYAVALAFPPGGPVPTGISQAISHAVP
jgi:hypothetical protein